jgi:hypothetical protein
VSKWQPVNIATWTVSAQIVPLGPEYQVQLFCNANGRTWFGEVSRVKGKRAAVKAARELARRYQAQLASTLQIICAVTEL